MEGESVQGDAGFESGTRESQTREPRRVDATNAGFDTRVQVRTRGERRREHELRVALIQEREDPRQGIVWTRGEILVSNLQGRREI